MLSNLSNCITLPFTMKGVLQLSATALLLLITLYLSSAAYAAAANIGKRHPSEKTVYMDPVTGFPVTVLTTNSANDQRIYQTHPQWTADGQYIVFRSNRSGRVTQAFAVNEVTGEIIQLTDDPAINSGSLNLARRSMKLYVFRGGGRRGGGLPVQIVELDLAMLLADSEADAMKKPEAYERVCAALPEGMRDSGGFGLDAEEEFAYVGVRGGDVGEHLPDGVEVIGVPEGARMGAGPGGLRSVNLATGEIKVIIDTPFQMGHVQTNPWIPGEIIYCHETGGDALQRMWTVMADGTRNRPLYVETPDEWVTHETVVTKDEVMFNIIGHQHRLRLKPSGIAVINLRNDEMKIMGQVEAPAGQRNRGGFWHCNGSADGRWAVGDTFQGNIHVIDRRTGKVNLLTTDHRMRPDHAHPAFSPDSSRVLIQSGRLTDGQSLDLMVISIPDEIVRGE